MGIGLDKWWVDSDFVACKGSSVLRGEGGRYLE